MNYRNRISYLLVLLACLFVFSGCRNVIYTIEMRPDGGTLHRALNLTDDLLDAEDLERLSALYGIEPPTEPLIDESGIAYYRFEGEFNEQTPDDLGGVGYFLHYTSPMGSASIYSEQFGGFDDPAAILEAQKLAFDRMFDVILLWIEHEMGEFDGFAELHYTIDEVIRKDLWNLNWMFTTTNLIAPTVMPGNEDAGDRAGAEFVTRALHYLVARGYLKPGEILALDQIDDELVAIEFIMRIVARKLGVADDEPLPPIFANYLSNMMTDAHGDSWQAFVADDNRIAAMLDSWNNEPGNSVEYVIDDGKFMEVLARQAFTWEINLFHFNTGYTVLDVDLALPVEPYLTNGDWEPVEEGVLNWQEKPASTDPMRPDLPNNLFALWAEPDVDYQVRHFGEVVLADGKLTDFCTWYLALPKSRQDEWNGFVQSLEPGADLLQRVTAFRFSDEKPDVRSAAGSITYAIRRVLKPKDSEQD